MSSPRDDNPYQAPLTHSQPPLSPGELEPPLVKHPSGRATHVRYFVVAAFCLAALIAYAQRNSISVAESAMRQEMGLDKYQMGLIMSAFFLSYSIFQIPTGLLGQFMGTRRGLSLVVGSFSAITGAFAMATGLWPLYFTRFGMGAAQAGIFPCCVNSISKWVPDTRRSISSGMLASFMSVGGALGVFMTGALLPLVGWRVAHALYALPGIAFAVLFYVWFRDRPQDHAAVSEEELHLIQQTSKQKTLPDKPTGELDGTLRGESPLYALRVTLALGALCGQQFFRAAGYMFFTSWFATYLRETRGVGDLQVGFLNSLPLLAVVVGSPLGGLVSDGLLSLTGSRRLSRQGVAMVAMLACAGLILVSYTISNPLLAVLLISAGSFFAGFGGPCAYTATIDMGGKYVPTVFGTMNMTGNIGAFVFPIVVPWLLVYGVPQGESNWNLVLFVFAGIYVAAAAFWALADTSVSIGKREDV